MKMESMRIAQEPIDLYEFRVTNKDSERQAITEIQSQILKWLQDEDLDVKIKSIRSSSILLNKLTYYITNDIEKKNSRLKISRGWYKYGPCYENGRQGEGSITLTLFDYLLPSKMILPEVEDNCKTEIPLFLKDIEKNHAYPFEYLKHIYTDRVDFPKIQKFYLAKHFLAGLASEYSKNPTETNIEELNKLTINFDKEILSSQYRSIVGIPPKDIDLILEFTALMNQILSDTLDNPTEKQKSLAQKVIYDFNNIVLMTFANKNYIFTFRTSNYRHENIIKSITENAYAEYMNKTQSLIGEYYQALN